MSVMSDDNRSTSSGTDIAPAAPTSSLSPALLERKTEIEAQVGTLAYWNSPGLQEELRALYRAEHRGAADYAMPVHELDHDMLPHAGAMDLSRFSAFIHDGETAGHVRSFVEAMCQAVGASKISDAIFEAFRNQNLTPAVFAAKARSSGWTQHQIDTALAWYRDRQAHVQRGPSPATEDERLERAQLMLEIESVMYIDGRPNPLYFGGPLESRYRELLEGK